MHCASNVLQMSCTLWRLLHNIYCAAVQLLQCFALGLYPLHCIVMHCTSAHCRECLSGGSYTIYCAAVQCTLTSLHLFCFAVFAPIAPYCNALCIKYLANFLHSQCLAQDCTAVLLSKTFQPVVQTTFSNGCCPIQAM